MKAVASDIDATQKSWADAMRAGDLARAWMVNDADLAVVCRANREKHEGPRHLQRIWRGEELRNRRVLIRCYHGLGDTIQFVRFMPALRAIASDVSLWCQSELLTLLEHMEGVDRFIALHDGVPDADFDVDLEIMEIPHAIRARREQVEMRRPYLTLPQRGGRLALKGGNRLTVGLVWEVGNWDKRRAIPASLLGRLHSDDIQLCSLQRGATATQLAAIGAKDISTSDICAVGHRIMQLDLLVCVDTMVAHLAGALGREAWVLLHADCDWRWPASGSRTFWYPSLRLFRQRTPGDWSSVIEEVRCALLERAIVSRLRQDGS